MLCRLLPSSRESWFSMSLEALWRWECRHSNTDNEKIGTGTVSVAEDIAEVQKVLKASGLKYTLHSAGTTVGALFLACTNIRLYLLQQTSQLQVHKANKLPLEGSWNEVMAAVGKAHAVVHRRGVVRIQSSMRVGSR